ncbi:uncharacterized protein LOC113563869 [Drosophila erecta]|uniref:uncharacterized protein LOC113563869 n=1 Tax=Drosophila erecta TaxID=7220 RepID=UPI000F064575|nr:uncharacterized protein LOC113563869 [Drosophila erecta]
MRKCTRIRLLRWGWCRRTQQGPVVERKRLIKELQYHDGAPGKLSGFVNEVEQLLNLYPTQDARQAHVIYGAVRRLILDSVMEVAIQARATIWMDIKTTLAVRTIHSRTTDHS